jgi:glycosyltransferase involved in cell wall biosynthesis
MQKGKWGASEIILIIPCYNEAKRWNIDYWNKLSKIKGLKLVFVNDGSTDQTAELVHQFVSKSVHCALNLESNVGKAEAVRNGFNYAFKSSPQAIGFLDADEAFTFEEVKRQINRYLEVNSPQLVPTAVWSSRVQLAGRELKRNMSRHYLARILITFLAARLGFSIYDPQSGLKIYPNSNELRQCFETSFRTRWFVDLEIYMRWKSITSDWMKVWEEPVVEWKDVQGSKITGKEYFRICKDLLILSNNKGT